MTERKSMMIRITLLSMRIGASAVASSAAGLTPSMEHAGAQGDRPNVVLFFLDDSGYGDYAHNGNPTIHTPNISRIANR